MEVKPANRDHGSQFFSVGHQVAEGLTIAGPATSRNVTFYGPNGPIFSILPDGSVRRESAFTTDDEASLSFWDVVEKSFPRLLTKV
jgi:hypothetical protein